ncbi:MULTISPECIES: dioxygenase [unclassified Streptomyces]
MVGVLSQIDAADPRVQELMSSLVMHAHAFICENEVTWDEWLTGLDFLARVGRWTTPDRNEFLLMSDISGSSALLNALNRHQPWIPAHATGKRAVSRTAPVRRMGDVIATEEEWADGDWALVHGRVLDTDHEPVAGARMDIRQARGSLHFTSQAGGPSALLITGADGRYRFRTVRPRSYSLPADGPGGEWLRVAGCQPVRPGHILASVEARSHRRLDTRLFAADDPLLHLDPAVGVKDARVLEFPLNDDPAAIEAAGMPGPYFDVSCDLVLVPDTRV